MLEGLNKPIMDISIPYYEDNAKISNSAIGWYLISSQYFFKMLSGEGEKFEASFLRTGTMIHMYVLQYEEFWKNYRVSDVSSPSSAQQKSFADNYIKSKEKTAKLKAVEAYKASYSTKGKSEDKIALEAIEMAEKIGDYIKELELNDSRERISFYEANTLKEIRNNILLHDIANTLVNPKNPDEEVYSEFHINWIDKETNLECKSLIDRLIINHNDKYIRLVDLKTTAKINHFRNSMEEYGYFRQMIFYKRAIEWYFTNVLKLNFNEYKFEIYIVGISTNDLTKNEIRVFNIMDYPEDLELYDKQISEVLTKIKWHNTMNLKDHSYEYYNNKGFDLLCG